MKKLNWMYAVVMFVMTLLAWPAFAVDEINVEVDPYAGFITTAVDAYGIDDDVQGVVAGFWMDDRVALELTHQESDELEFQSIVLIGSLYNWGDQKFTFQLGYGHAQLDGLGDASDTFAMYGLGYEVTWFRHVILRAQYNMYDVDEALNGDKSADGVSFAAAYQF